MRNTLYALLGAALFLGGASVAFAEVTTLNLSCVPYTAPFIEEQAYIPTEHSNCTISTPTPPSAYDTTYIMYRGVPSNNPEFIRYETSVGDPIFIMSDVVYSGSGPTTSGENYFWVAVNTSVAGLFDWHTYFLNGGTAPGDYSIINWHWGTPATVTANDQTMEEGGTVPTLTSTITGFINGQTLSTSGITGAPSCTTTATAASPAGDYPITCTKGTLFSDLYAFDTFVSGTLHITQIVPATSPLTVTADNKTMPNGGPLPTFTATLSGFIAPDTASSNDVTGSASCTTTATASSPAGDYPITCTQGTLASAGTYTFETFVPGVLTVEPAAPVSATVIVTPYSLTYDGNSHTAAVVATGAHGEDLSAYVDLSATTHTNAGDYAADTWSFHDPSGTYADTQGTVHNSIAQAASITIVSCPASVTYTGSAQTPCTASVTGAGGLDQSVAVTYTNNVNAGAAGASASFAGDSNHTGSSDTKDFTITKAPLTITADNKSMYPNTAIPALTSTLSDFVGNDTTTSNDVTGSASCSTTATPSSPIGTYSITCSQGTLNSNNYSFTNFVPGTLTVAPPPPTRCLWALNPTATGLHMSGSGTIRGNGCIMQIQSSSASAVNITGSAGIQTVKNCVVGGVKKIGSSTVSPAATNSCFSVSEPFATITKPTVPTTCDFTNYTHSGSGAATLTPGTYCGGMKFSGSNTITFTPGIYIFKNGPLTVSGSEQLVGSGVSFFLTGTNAGITSSGSGSWHFTAPLAGLLSGFVFYLDSSSDVAASSQFLGSSDLYLEGVTYLPKQTLIFAGSNKTSVSSPFTSLVADRFVMSGLGVFTLNGDTAHSSVPVPAGLFFTN